MNPYRQSTRPSATGQGEDVASKPPPRFSFERSDALSWAIISVFLVVGVIFFALHVERAGDLLLAAALLAILRLPRSRSALTRKQCWETDP